MLHGADIDKLVLGWGGIVVLLTLVVLAIRTRHVAFAATAIVLCAGVGCVREIGAFKVAARLQIEARRANNTYLEAYRDGVVDMERAAYESSRYVYVAIGGLTVLAVGFYNNSRRR